MSTSYPVTIETSQGVERSDQSRQRRSAGYGFNEGADTISRYINMQSEWSANTRRSYANALRQSVNIMLQLGLSERKEIQAIELKPSEARQIVPVHVKAVFKRLRLDGKSAATVRLYHTALSNFFAALDEADVIEETPYKKTQMTRPKKARIQDRAGLMQHLTRTQAEALVRSAGQLDKPKADRSLTGARDAALVLVLLNCALRRGEVSAMRYSDIVRDGDAWKLVLPETKAGAPQAVPMQNFVKRAIDEMRAHYGISGDVVFPALDRVTMKAAHKAGASFTGWRQMSTHAIYKTIVSASERAGVAISPHVLRHTAGTLAAQGGNIHDVKELLRHSSVDTTTIYTHVGNEGAKRAAALVSVGM